MLFSVWAPHASSVQLAARINNGMRRFDMEPDEHGWYFADVEPVEAGVRYGFILDGAGKPLPDPRSMSQPEGPHELSELVDHRSFAWTDHHWRGPALSASVLYELHIGTFTPEGTFDSAISKLDHLIDLGITTVELLPVAESPGVRGWGYDGVDLFAPHHAYGGPDAMKRFVDACHARGLAVVLDVVYNHLGPDGNYLGAFGPYFTDVYSTPWGSAINYDDRGSDEVRRFVIDNALMWFYDYHVDGLRLDAVHAIYDKSAVHLFEQMSFEVEQLAAATGNPLYLIGESALNDPKVVKSRELGGWGLQGQWSDDFHHALHVALTGERAGYYEDFGGWNAVAEALQHAFVYRGQFSEHLDRSFGRPVGDLPAWHFLGYLQNHDQIGNRATGERSAALMSAGSAKIGAALVLLGPFVPMLFMGEEWAASTPWQYFTDHNDELGALVSEGRRSEFGHFGWRAEDVPDPQSAETFQRSKLQWQELASATHADMFTWHQALIALRRSEPALNDGAVDIETSHDGDVFTMRRGDLHVLANVGKRRSTLSVGDADIVLTSTPEVGWSDDGTLVLPSETVVILRSE